MPNAAMKSMQNQGHGHARRASMMTVPSGMRMVYGHDSFNEDIFGREPLPTPPHTAPIRQISAFDMAPLQGPQYLSINSMAMDSSMSEQELDLSYFSPTSDITPPFSSMHSTPNIEHASAYGQMPTCGPEISGHMNAMSNPHQQPSQLSSTQPAQSGMPALAPAPTAADSKPQISPNSSTPSASSRKPRHVMFQTSPTPVTQEDIQSYISGPENHDGKWVCLFPDCNKRFGRKENIKSHVQTHLGDRQYKCQVCRKCFVRQHDLKRHSKIHTGIKPYECKCGNSFARHDALTRHRQRGMCCGAFEGIVKKVVKRGRPRKKPLPEDEGKENKDGTVAKKKEGTEKVPAIAPKPSDSTGDNSRRPSAISVASTDATKSRSATPDSEKTLSPTTNFDFQNFLNEAHAQPTTETSQAPSSTSMPPSVLSGVTTSGVDFSSHRKFALSLENTITTSGPGVSLPPASHAPHSSESVFSDLQFLSSAELSLDSDGLLDFNMNAPSGVIGLCSAPEDAYIRPEVLGGGFV